MKKLIGNTSDDVFYLWFFRSFSARLSMNDSNSSRKIDVFDVVKLFGEEVKKRGLSYYPKAMTELQKNVVGQYDKYPQFCLSLAKQMHQYNIPIFNLERYRLLNQMCFLIGFRATITICYAKIKAMRLLKRLWGVKTTICLT